jgi:hypothetical protein
MYYVDVHTIFVSYLFLGNQQLAKENKCEFYLTVV